MRGRLQQIFDNPTPVRKKSSAKGRKIMAKKKTKRNPMKVSYKATEKGKGKKRKTIASGSTKVFPTPTEVARQNVLIKAFEEQKSKLASSKKNKKKRAALQKKIQTQKKKLKIMQMASKAARAGLSDARTSIKGSGAKFSAKTSYTKKKGAKKVAKRKKKKTTKKKATKRKASKKKATKKKTKRKATKKKTKRKATKKKTKRKTTKKKTKRKTTKKKTKRKSTRGAFTTPSLLKKKRKATKKKATRKKAKRKSSKRRKKVVLKKGQSVVVRSNPKRKKSKKRKYKNNPTAGGKMGKGLERWLGYSPAELGSFALGGAFYAASNSMLARFARPVQAMLAQIPVVGPALPNILVGVGLNYMASVVKNKMVKDTARSIGEGLIASSVVGMGVNAAQFVPGLQPALMSGVDFTEEIGSADYQQLGQYKQRAGDFGAVEFTPGTDTLTGVDFTQDQDITADFGSEYSDADFGEELSEGLG